MRVIFMGTPDFAVASLEALLREHEVLAVITQPDKPKGRGKKLAFSPVKEYALAHGLAVLQPERVKAPEFVEELRKYNAELIAVTAFGQILPEEILNMPEYGCINVHGSLLPKYRGAAPIQWSVLNGDLTAGVTTMYMAEGMDTGDMILSRSVPVGEDETSGELFDRLAVLGAEALSETVRLIAGGNAPRTPQDDAQASRASMLTKEMAVIDWSKSAREVHNLIRGMNPWPTAHTRLGGKVLKVHRSRVVEGAGEPGIVLDGKRLIVGCGEGAVELVEIQPEGSRRMPAADYLRGHPVETGTRLGE